MSAKKGTAGNAKKRVGGTGKRKVNRALQMEKLLTRAVSDKEFRERLIATPDQVAEELGLTPGQLKALKSAKRNLAQLPEPVQMPPNDARIWSIGVMSILRQRWPK